MTSIALNIAIGLAVVALLLARQLRTRPVSTDRSPRVMVILGVLGIVEIGSYTSRTHVDATAWVLLVVSLAIAAVLGVLRGRQMHVWSTSQGPMRKGNAITCVLWIVSIGLHLLIDIGGGALADVPSGFGSASLLLYIALTLGTQQVIVAERARRLSPQVAALPSV